jgi:hypothetical protein
MKRNILSKENLEGNKGKKGKYFEKKTQSKIKRRY